MKTCSRFVGISRFIRGKLKSNRTFLIALGLVLLLCFSYLEIFFVRGQQKYDTKLAQKHPKEATFKVVSNVSADGHKVPYIKVTEQMHQVPQTTVSVMFTTTKSPVKVRHKTHTKSPKCEIEPTFKSIRWIKNWKRTLSIRYGDLLKGLRGGSEAVQEKPGVPKWQIELRKQKYIVAAAFQPIISEMEFKILMETFYTLAEALVSANVTFFLYGGSHLGVYRHHGLVPWDDDVDIMLNASQKELAKAVLANIPYYSLYSPPGHQWKFFETSLTTIIHKPYRWPFIDIFFFSENSTHIWDELPLYQSEFSYRKCDVFPLVHMPFEGGYVPVPCNSKNTLAISYSTHICKSNTYWHKFESYAPRSRKKIIQCSLLHEMFPFVFRSRANSKCQIEDRKIGNLTLNSVSLPVPCKCPV